MNKTSLLYLFKSFLKIGAMSWGGHLSLLSIARQRLVEIDNVITDKEVVETISLASILPGPMAVNIVAFWGFKLRGWRGALVSSIAVLLPAFIAIIILSYLYFKYVHLAILQSFFIGIMPAVAAIIFSTGLSMIKKESMDRFQWALMLLSTFIFIFYNGYWISFISIVLSAFAGFFLYRNEFKKNAKQYSANNIQYKASVLTGFLIAIILSSFFFIFGSPISKALEQQFAFISLTQIGGGYVVIPSMEKIFVDSLHWLTHQEFVEGIALSQVTPGPIFIIAAFVGFKMNNFGGSIVATVSVFLPSALLMILLGIQYGKIQSFPLIKSAFKGIKPVVIGMIFSASFNILLKQSSHQFWIGIFMFILGLLLLFKTKINQSLIILIMGIAGTILFNK